MRLGLTLGTLAAAQLLAGLVGQLWVLRVVGVGPATDAYIAAQAVPMVLAAIVSTSLQSLWLPRLSRLAHEPASLRREQGVALGQSIRILAGLSLPLALASAWWAPALFPGLGADQIGDVVTLGLPLFLATILNGQIGILAVSCRVQGHFLKAEVIGLFGSLAAVALIVVLVPHYGILAAAWIALLRALGVQIALRASMAGVLTHWLADASSRTVAKQLRPLVGGAVFIKSNPLVDRYWSSQAPGGGLTTLNVAQLLINSLAAVIERALLTSTLPQFARLLQDGDLVGLRKAYMRCLTSIAAVVGVVTLALLALWPLWDALLGAVLNIPPATAQQIWRLGLILLPALYVAVGGSAAVAVFYAFGETRVPVLIGICGFAASLVLKAVLFHAAGIEGLALGASIYLVLNMTAYHVAVDRRIRRAHR